MSRPSLHKQSLLLSPGLAILITMRKEDRFELYRRGDGSKG